ncbi:MAG: nitroreductase family deazaflavin-dependent oxidoreductase [Chloroflexia bacterium]|nr:nitroreductase family deazaflavin-dependent oxidoreductase [Chloroflexia bacterium]
MSTWPPVASSRSPSRGRSPSRRFPPPSGSARAATTEVKSGKRTVSPLVATVDGDRLLVYASAGGASANPAWYHNLVANPEVTVEFGTDAYTAQATVVTGDERDRLWDAQVARAPGFGEYQRNLGRVIPVVALGRAHR